MLNSSPGPSPQKRAPEADGSERRIDPRHDFTGAQMRLVVGGLSYVLQLKDLSCTGVCGLTDAPIRPGQTIFLQLDGYELMPVQICWVRRAFFGAAFEQPIDPQLIRKLRRAWPQRARRR